VCLPQGTLERSPHGMSKKLLYESQAGGCWGRVSEQLTGVTAFRCGVRYVGDPRSSGRLLWKGHSKNIVTFTVPGGGMLDSTQMAVGDIAGTQLRPVTDAP